MTASVQPVVPSRRFRFVTKLLLFEILFFCAACVWIFAGKDIAPFHGDEATYIRMSRDYDYLVHQRDLRRILYRPNPVEGRMEQEVRITTGSITTFCIGFARRLAGLNGENVNGFWRWDSSPAQGYQLFLQNVAAGRYPDPVSLHVSRIPSSVFGMLSIPLLYMAMLKLTKSRFAAGTAAILLATSPMFLIHVRRAMQEGVKLFSLTLCLYMAARVVEDMSARSASKRIYYLLGIAAGFTLAAKQDAAAALVAIYSGLALIAFLNRGTPHLFRSHLAGLAASAVLAFGVFFAMMPVWWEWWANIVILLCIAAILFCAASIGSAPAKRLWMAPVGILNHPEHCDAVLLEKISRTFEHHDQSPASSIEIANRLPSKEQHCIPEYIYGKSGFPGADNLLIGRDGQEFYQVHYCSHETTNAEIPGLNIERKARPLDCRFSPRPAVRNRSLGHASQTDGRRSPDPLAVCYFLAVPFCDNTVAL